MAYSNAPADKLYGLLPATIRAGDAAGGEPLRALLRVIESGADLIEGDIAQLAANAFVETAEPWAVPYIGELVGWTSLAEGGAPGGTAAELFHDLAGPTLAPARPYRPRADVARTIHYRRRKGTLTVLELLARDIAGWPAHAVEGFAAVGWTQWLRNHRRALPGGTADLREPARTARTGGAFDPHPYTLDVRPPDGREGRSGLAAVTIWLWRLLSLAVEGAIPRGLDGPDDWRRRFSPLGQDAPLFARGTVAAERRTAEADQPGPIPCAAFCADPSALYGGFDAVPGAGAVRAPSLAVEVGGTLLPVEGVDAIDLSEWRQPEGARVAVDVALGRLALGPDLADAGEVRVSYHEGRVAPMGGGSYARPGWMIARAHAGLLLPVGPGAHADIAAALAAWEAAGKPDATIRLADNRTHQGAMAVSLDGATGTRLTIEAADGYRPHLIPDGGAISVDGARADFVLTLSGVLVEGRVAAGTGLARLRLLHATLVPGGSLREPSDEPSIVVAAEARDFALELAFAITGPLALPEHAAGGLTALDSIVDGRGGTAIGGIEGDADRGPDVRLERCTVYGAARVRSIVLAEDSILDGAVDAARVQAGCVRHCWVAPGARTPRRYRCQPDLAERRALEAAGQVDKAARDRLLAEVRARVRPGYTDMRYGQPAYLQLAASIAAEIATGAQDGSEMGAHAAVGDAIRAANLTRRIAEYLPSGLDAGLAYVT